MFWPHRLHRRKRTAILGHSAALMAQPLILRVKRAREEDATPETLVVAAPPSKRRTLDQSLAALSTEQQPQNVLHRCPGWQSFCVYAIYAAKMAAALLVC